jgi:uncharacterized protein (TIGR03032 family)
MATSQLLRGLIGERALIVSSHSDNKILSFQNNAWTNIYVNDPRGLAINEQLIAVASKNSVIFYDRLTGLKNAELNVSSEGSHEIEFGINNEIITCASPLSSLVNYNLGYSSTIWTVPGVDLDTTDARSWVNGICTVNGIPQYVTVLGISNVENGWREEALASRGALINVQTNEIVLHNLLFPHTPTIDGNDIWFLNSGLNQVCRWTPGDSDFTVVATLHGWTRGIAIIDDYIFVGVSQGRMSAFPNVISDPLAEPGIVVLNRLTGEPLEFESIDAQEIFDLAIVDKAIIG